MHEQEAMCHHICGDLFRGDSTTDHCSRQRRPPGSIARERIHHLAWDSRRLEARGGPHDRRAFTLHAPFRLSPIAPFRDSSLPNSAVRPSGPPAQLACVVLRTIGDGFNNRAETFDFTHGDRSHCDIEPLTHIQSQADSGREFAARHAGWEHTDSTCR